ncbi:MAG: response regulator [Chloroherpetonaceae bacterium]|nr:response regulator [Chloroherpetonaceae bacterium]MDW8437739.1 response regulator [Chloroherpetonaceae bacterium]
MRRTEYAVLIVDDNDEDVALLQRFLSRSPIPIRSVSLAQTGNEALDKIRSERPDFLIVGETFVDMSGDEFLRHLSQTTPLDAMPVLCLVSNDASIAAQVSRAHRFEVVKKTMLTPEKLRDAMAESIERVELRQARNRAETLFALLSENISHPIALTDAEGVLIAANKSYLSLFRLDESSVGQKLGAPNYDEIFRSSEHQAEAREILRDGAGNEIRAKVKRLFVEEGGKRVLMLTILETALDDEPDASDAPTSEPAERETNVLRKFERDIKDAIQTASIILRAKTKRPDKKNLDELLQEHRQYLRFVALAAECATPSDSSSTINLGRYAQEIVKWFEKSPLMREGISFRCECDEVWVELGESALVGFILSELISNALQHAFKGRGGVVTVAVAKEKDQAVSVVVSDNGVGLPAKVDKPFRTVGLLVVSSLVKRLEGKLEIKRHLGTSIRVVFPQKNPRGA